MLDGILFLFCNFLYLFLKVSDGDAFPPPLSPEEERECFEAMAKGDRSAREKLIRYNLRLVAHIVRKYYPGSKNQDDLISTGTVGLIKAVDSFNPENGTRFATYAAKCLQNEILMQFRSQKKLTNEVSVNETIDMDKDGNPLTYCDVIAVEDDIAENLDLKMRSAAALKCVMTGLDKREREIIILRYGLSDTPCKTQRQVAELLGISRSYVSRIEKAALCKVREQMKRYGFD